MLAVLDIACPDFPITWAGRGRHDDEFCFGAEDGRLRFTTINGDLIDDTLVDNDHSEVVNGVAFHRNFVAVSSRAEVVFWKMPQPPDERWAPASCSYGSHGVIATGLGDFLCPLGPNGVMRARLSAPQDSLPIDRIRASDQALDYYKLISLESDGAELLVCAVRKNGIATVESLGGADTPLLNFTIHGELDVIDVCSLESAAAPRAAAGLCRDGTLLFFNDILDQACRVSLRFDEIQGTAYRILSAQEMTIVLTSHGLYVLPRLLERVRQSQGGVAPPVSGIIEPLEAIDANLVGEHWLLVVMTDQVRRYDVNSFAERPRKKQAEEARVFQPIAADHIVTPHSAVAELVHS